DRRLSGSQRGCRSAGPCARTGNPTHLRDGIGQPHRKGEIVAAQPRGLRPVNRGASSISQDRFSIALPPPSQPSPSAPSPDRLRSPPPAVFPTPETVAPSAPKPFGIAQEQTSKRSKDLR